MNGGDPLGLFGLDDVQAPQRAAALAQALRRQRAAGGLGLLTGDPVLAGYGQSQLEEAQRAEQLAGQARQQQVQGGLQRAMAQQEQGFKAGESEKARGFEGSQNALQRALQRELEGLRGERERTKAEAVKTEAAAKTTTDLRKEMQGLPEYKAFNEVSVAYDKVKRSANSGTAAGDMSLVFGYMKLLDPGSTVREGEYASARNAGGVPEYIQNLYNKAKDGQFLTPEQRGAFVGEAGKLYGAHVSQMAPVFERYRGLATKLGADPEDVSPQGRLQAPSAPAVGGGGLSSDEAEELKRLESKYGGGQ